MCLVAALSIATIRYFYPSDYAKWKARVPAGPELPIPQEPGSGGLPPCFFIVPQTAIRQTLDSGSIDDCLLLLPDGRNLDVFEIVLGGGFFPIKTDLYVPDTIPLAFTRTYVTLTGWADRFQVYLPHVWEPFLTGSRRPYTYLDWRLPDGQSVHYERISPGTGNGDAIYGAASSARILANSRVNWNGLGWDWTLADGTTYLSPEAYYSTRPQQGSLVGIFDRNGNEVRLSRDANGQLTEIRSPSGRWIRFEYSQAHMTRARDSAGNLVEYEYDSGDRPTAVKYPGGRTTRYSYDTADRLIKVDDPSEEVELEIRYDASGAVAAVTADGEHTYNFRYVPANSSKTAEAFVIDPSGKVTQVSIRNREDRISYSIHK